MFRGPIAGFVATLLAFAVMAALLVCAPAGARDTEATPALWKVDGPSGHVYFFGSIHVLPKGSVWRSRELDVALAAAQQLVFEVDVDEAQNPKEMSLLVKKYAFLQRGESLHAMLTPGHSERLDAVARSVGLEPSTVDRMRPWLAAMTLGQSGPSVYSAGTQKSVGGVDMQLWAWAKAAGKERGVLETAEDQVRVFADLSREQELELLTIRLEEAQRTSEALSSLVEAWKVGDTAKLDEAFNAEMSDSPALRKAVLRDRHEKWLPQIERMMRDGRTHVVVVGTAHLVGQDSLIAILRAKGVAVEGP